MYNTPDCITVSGMHLVVTVHMPVLQKPANILVMGEGPERGRIKIGEI